LCEVALSPWQPERSEGLYLIIFLFNWRGSVMTF